MRRKKTLTKRARRPSPGRKGPAESVNCVSCGRTIGRGEFVADPPTALVVVCEHGSRFPACARCEVGARHAVAEHDREGSAVARRPSA